MSEAVPYPSPPPGPLRDVHSYLHEGILSPRNADILLRQGFPWSLVAPHVQDREWWGAQCPADASPPTLPWRITAWDATLRLEIPGESLWVDPGPSAPLPSRPPDLIIVTHAHHDHTARLGEFSANHPDTRIVMSHGTASLLSLRSSFDPLLQECLRQRVVRLDFGENRAIGGVRVKLRPAGHLLGAAMVEIQSGKDSLLITGDFAFRDVGGIAGALWPQEVYALVIVESTAADRGTLPVADPEANRRPFLQEVDDLLNRGKTRLLASAQAMGQAQELYATLALAQQAGAFPTLRVRLAGFAESVSEKYYKALKGQAGPWSCPFLTLATDQIPENSLVIASGLDSEGKGGMTDSLVCNLEGTPDGWVLKSPSVHTHAGWSERMAWGVGIPCYTVVLYHGFSPTLQIALSQIGRRIEALSEEGKEWMVPTSL